MILRKNSLNASQTYNVHVNVHCMNVDFSVVESSINWSIYLIEDNVQITQVLLLGNRRTEVVTVFICT